MGLWPESLSEFLKYHGAFASARPARPGPVPDSLKMIPPNRPGTYLIRRALKNDSDPCNECSKRCHERQVMKVFVQGLIWYHGTMVPWYRGTMVPWYDANSFEQQLQPVTEQKPS